MTVPAGLVTTTAATPALKVAAPTATPLLLAVPAVDATALAGLATATVARLALTSKVVLYVPLRPKRSRARFV